jgi:hypothetical protein
MKLNQKLPKSAAPACLIALLMCSIFGAQYAQAQTKVSEQPQIKALEPEQAASAQLAINPILGVRPTTELEALRQTWAKTMHRTPAPKEGCFQASYPSTQWQEVQCAPPNGYRSARPRRLNQKGAGHEDVGGTGGGTPLNNDIVVQAPSGHLLSKVIGSFPTANGIASESSVGVAAFGGGGALGANEYTLQVNTNTTHSAACGSFSNCLAWQQYVFATNTFASFTSTALTDKSEVFIEYWLFDYGVDNGSNICPSGFFDAGPSVFGSPGDDCLQNTPGTVVQDGQLPITDLGDLTFSGSATADGTDEATLTYNGQAYKATVPDSNTDISSVWNQAEFNVVGNAGGSEAVFNNGTSLIAKLEVTDGSTSAPLCVFNGGSTGESNNLNFVPSTTSPVCCPYGGSDPSIGFMEVFDTHTHTASCGASSITGEPHITTVNDVYYNFQAAGEFVALLDPDGTEIETRQTALPTVAPGNYDPSGLNDDGLVSCLAMNTAVAARVGSHRVTYEPSFSVAYGKGPFDLRIDGKLATPGAGGINLGDGAEVKNSAAGGGIEVDFPDGKIMTAIPSGSLDSMNLLNVQFEKTGLLGDGEGAEESGIAGDVPRGSWLPALPTGASLGAMPATLHQRYVTLYNTFGNAWRVTSKNTLFDYAPGTSTATFSNTSWPVENAKTCTIPNQPVVKPVSAAVAEEACRSVSDATLHAGCLFDVQATGVTGFARTYEASESAHKILSVRPIDAKLLVTAIK